MSLIGEGGAMMGDIQEVFAHYIIRKEMSLVDARKLYIEVAEEFIKRYNDDEKIRKYLHNYPFTIENVELDISFENEQGDKPPEGCVAYIYTIKKNEKDGTILYYRDYKEGKLSPLHKEPYATAVEIVKNQK